jgi:hypothetical protein
LGEQKAGCGRKKSGGEPPHSIGEDGRELSKGRISHKVMAVKDNYVAIRMCVAN